MKQLVILLATGFFVLAVGCEGNKGKNQTMETIKKIIAGDKTLAVAKEREWKLISTEGDPASAEFNSLLFAKNYGNVSVLFAGTWGAGAGLYRIEYSPEKTTATVIYPLKDFLCLKLDPNNSNVLWGTNWNGKVYKFENIYAGQPTVTMIEIGPKECRPVWMEIDRTNSNRLLCATLMGLYRSDDGGAKWQRVELGSTGEEYMAFYVSQSPWNPDLYYVTCVEKGRGFYEYNAKYNELVKKGLEKEHVRTVEYKCKTGWPDLFIMTSSADDSSMKVYSYNGFSMTMDNGEMIPGGNDRELYLACSCRGQYLYSASVKGRINRCSLSGGRLQPWEAFSKGFDAGALRLEADTYNNRLFVGATRGLWVNSLCD